MSLKTIKKIEQGLKDAKEGRVYSSEEVYEMLDNYVDDEEDDDDFNGSYYSDMYYEEIVKQKVKKGE
jgi:hypothetical protein